MVRVEKDNLESSSSSTPLSDAAVRVLRTLGLNVQSDLDFSAGSNPGRISIVHGTTAEVIWCDEIGHETTSTSQFATTLNLSPVAGDWVSIRDGYIISVSARTTELRRPGATPGDVQVARREYRRRPRGAADRPRLERPHARTTRGDGL